MSHKHKDDLLTRLPSEMEFLESRQQIARADRNIATIREIAENRMGSARYSQEHAPGPYQVDVHVDTSGIEEWLEEASEASSAIQDRLEGMERDLAWRMDAAMEQAAQSQQVLKEIAVNSRRTQEHTHILSTEITQLKTISGLHLGIATTALALQRSSNKALEGIQATLDEGFDSLGGSLEDIQDTLDEGFESLELAVVQSGAAIVSRLDSVLAGQRSQTNALGLMLARSSTLVASFIDKSIAALNRAQKERHAELIQTMREPLSIQAQQKYQDALLNFRVGSMGAALQDLEEVFKRKSTHVLGWILFGQVSFACGRSREAKDAYALAARYAWPDFRKAPVEARAYTTAVSLLAGLEYLQGNYAAALGILEEGIEKWRCVPDDPDCVELCDDLCMERIRLISKLDCGSSQKKVLRERLGLTSANDFHDMIWQIDQLDDQTVERFISQMVAGVPNIRNAAWNDPRQDIPGCYFDWHDCAHRLRALIRRLRCLSTYLQHKRMRVEMLNALKSEVQRLSDWVSSQSATSKYFTYKHPLPTAREFTELERKAVYALFELGL